MTHRNTRTFADSGPVTLVLVVQVDRTVFRELLDLVTTSELGQVAQKGLDSLRPEPFPSSP